MKPRRMTLLALVLALSMLWGVAGASPAAKTEIRINMAAGVGAAEAWAAVEKNYEALHPDVDIIIDLKPSEGYADWVKAQFASETPVADLVAINLAGDDAIGRCINFFDYAYDISPYTDKEWQEQFNFASQVRDMARGEWTALSLQSVQVLWFYNADIFAKVGVTPPATWDELIQVCEKLEAAGYQPVAAPGDFNSFWAMQLGWLAQIYVDQTTRSQIEIIRAQPGDFNYEEEKDSKFVYNPTDPWNDDAVHVTPNRLRFWQAFRDGKIRADTDGFKQVYANFAKVFPKYAGGENFFGTDDTGYKSLFAQGKAAIIIDGGWRLTEHARDMKALKEGLGLTIGTGDDAVTVENPQVFELGTFNMPSMVGEPFEAPARTIEVAVGFIGAVDKGAVHNEAVVDFLQYYSSPEGYSAFLGTGIDHGMSISGPPLVFGVELPEEYAAMFSNLSFIGNCQKGYGQALARGIGDNQEALRDWYGYTMDLMLGKIDIDKWAELHQENQMKHLPDVLAANKINPSDLDSPQNEPTGEGK